MSNIEVGSVVKSLAGRSKDGYFAVLEISDGFVRIADGKSYKCEKPKRKNIKHISPTQEKLAVSELTNKRLRRILREFETRNSPKP